jgi:hypothetical protein
VADQDSDGTGGRRGGSVLDRTQALRDVWLAAWADVAFRRRLVAGFAMVFVAIVAVSHVLDWVERRDGCVLEDPVLALFEPVDVTVLAFVLIYGCLVVGLADMVRSPARLVAFAWSYAFLLLLRCATLAVTPLDPPVTTIPLVDPVVQALVDGVVLTRDLFFSGHTSTTLLLGLCMAPSRRRWIVLGLAPVVGALTMLQHVHYTVDVLAAFPFAWLAYGLARPLAGPPAPSHAPTAGGAR